MAFRRRPKYNRKYRFRSGRTRWIRRTGFLCCLALLGLCVYKVGGYVSDYLRVRRQSESLQAAYLEETTAPLAALFSVTAAPVASPVPTAASTAEPSAEPTAAVSYTPDPIATLPPVKYPANPYLDVSERFQRLRRQNSDIIGWVSVGDILNEAVVQRDNEYYLRRDYQGYHNVNGAVFLDEACDLNTRPFTLTIYAHNMKTGAMFGSLRNYENIYFYRNNPIITFDTLYEDGAYVIFSVATVSTQVSAEHYSGFYRLYSCTNLEREAIIKGLRGLSEISTPVDVRIDDQLLLLVTCVGDDTDRRIVAARRVRDNEDVFDLRNLVQSAYTRKR